MNTTIWKECFFIYYSIIIEKLKTSFPLACILIILNTFQRLSLILYSANLELKSFNIFLETIRKFLDLFLPLKYVSKTSFLIFYFVGDILLVLEVIYLICVLMNLKKYEKSKYDDFYIWGFNCFCIYETVAISIFFLPRLVYYLYDIACLLGSSDTFLDKCDAFNTYLTIISVLFLVLLLIKYNSNALMTFNINVETENNLAYSFSPFANLFLSYQTILVICLFEHKFFFLFFPLLILAILVIFWVIRNFHVFHNPEIEKLFVASLSIDLYSLAYFEIMYSLENFTQYDHVYYFNFLYVIILPLFARFSYFLHQDFTEKLLMTETSEIEYDFLIDKKVKFHFFYTINQEIKNQTIKYKFTEKSALIIHGFYDHHFDYCRNINCLCKISKTFVYDYSSLKEHSIDKKGSINLNNLIYIKHLMMSEYNTYISSKRYRRVFLRINIASFVFTQLKNFHKSVVESIDIKENCFPNFFQQIPLYRLMRNIDKFQFNLDRNKYGIPDYSSLDFSGLISIEQTYNDLKSEIKVFIDDYLNFLKEIGQERPSIQSLESLSKILYERRLSIDKIFSKNSENPVSIRLYMEYLGNLIFSEDIQKPLEMKYGKKLELILTNQSNGNVFYQLDLMYNEESIICQMGSGKGNLGHIIRANEGMAKFVGYSIAELEFANINILMPTRIAEQHDMYLMNFMESSKGNVIYRERKIFARNKEGYIQFSSILMKPLYDYPSSIFKFVAFLQPFGQGIEFAVVDEHGFIDSISRGLGSILNMTPENYENKKLLIQGVSPSLMEIFIRKLIPEEKLNEPNIKTKLEKLQTPKLDNGDYLCKIFPFGEGVEVFRNTMDRIGQKIGKIGNDVEDFLDDLIMFNVMLERNIAEECTFVLQASLLILYSQDKTLEMNIFCFKEVDSIYLDIPLKLYAQSTMLKNLEFFLQNKEKILNADVNDFEADRLTKISFYDTKTFHSYSAEKKAESSDEEDSDEISLHMNSKLDAIFKKPLKTKREVDVKNKEDLTHFNNIEIIDELSDCKRSSESENDSKNRSEKSRSQTIKTNNSFYSNRNNKSIQSIWKKHNPKLKKLMHGKQQKQQNFANSRSMLTIQERANPSLTINEKNELERKQIVDKLTENEELARKNEKNMEKLKKENNTLFQGGSSVGSQKVQSLQAKKTLRASIAFDFLPHAFNRIIWLFVGSLFLIFICQAVSTITLGNTINDLRDSLEADRVYNSVIFNMIRLANSFYKIRLMAEEVIYVGKDQEQKKTIKNDILGLINQDVEEIIKSLRYFDDKFQVFNQICENQFLEKDEFVHDEKTLEFEISKAAILFVNSAMFAKKELNIFDKTYNFTIQENFIYDNLDKFFSIFKTRNYFDDFNFSKITDIKSSMIMVYSICCAVLFLLFIIRFYLYKVCFDYINSLFMMAGGIPNEEYRVLDLYLRRMKMIFESTFLLKLKNNIDLENNLDNLDKNRMLNTALKDQHLKNAGVQQRRTKIFTALKFPFTKIFLINFLWLIIFVMGYFGLLGIANIFDKKLESSIKTRSLLRKEQYIFPAKALFHGFSYFESKQENLQDPVFFEKYANFLKAELNSKLSELESYAITEEILYELMHHTNVCGDIGANQGERFFSKGYCEALLDGQLNIGILVYFKYILTPFFLDRNYVFSANILQGFAGN